ncbi:MAG: ABC transporter permease [Chloroflexota bacterium]|jgi:general nucleoside transport system permease protein
MTAAVSTTTKGSSAIRSHLPLIISIGVITIVAVGYYVLHPQQATAVYASTLRQSTPLVLGAMCGLVGERSGIINIGIEGQMLMSAFIAFLVNVYVGNLFIAIGAGIGAGALLGLFLAWMSITLKMDQIIGGTVINILALGLTSFFYVAGLTTKGKLQPIPLGPLADIPLLGPVLFNNPPLTYLTIILVFFLQFALFRTVWGLRTRAVGEHPSAADTVGIRVNVTRYINTTLAGSLAGLAGAYLTLEAVGSFERGMTNGRGFIALAVMIFGKWTPLGSWGAALLFGLASAMQTQFQFLGLDYIPHQFVGMFPYVLTIVVLAGFVGRSRPPAAEGKVYDPE